MRFIFKFFQLSFQIDFNHMFEQNETQSNKQSNCLKLLAEQLGEREPYRFGELVTLCIFDADDDDDDDKSFRMK